MGKCPLDKTTALSHSERTGVTPLEKKDHDFRKSNSPRVNDEYFRHVVEHAAFAMISADDQLAIRTWNSAAAKMFGASPSNMIGTSLISVIPIEGRSEGEHVFKDTSKTGDINSFEFEHRDEQGLPRNLAITVSPIVDDEGEHIGVLACLRDITRRVLLQEEVAQNNKMASLGRMAGALAHYVNNTVGGAVTCVDFALATDDPVLQNQALERTGEALARTTKLTLSLLAFAEGDNRHQDESDLTELLINIAEYMEPEMAAQGIVLELDFSDIPIVRVPRAQLVTVVENILHNAADAMPNGGKVIVATRREGDKIRLTISDCGCGMDPDQMKRAFEPFFTTKSGDSFDLEHHPGLGLTVAHGILQVLGHTIQVESKSGVATTVTVILNPKRDDEA
jgi:PAS domain S-box-containing protein